MNHKVYKDLILRESDLTPREREELQMHQMHCGECSQFHQAWKSARDGVTLMQCVTPQPGFVSRWNHTLQFKRQLQEIRHRRISLLAITAAATIDAGYYLLRSGSITRVFATVFTLFLELIMGFSKLSIQISHQVGRMPFYFSWIFGYMFFGICLAFSFACILLILNLYTRNTLVHEEISN